MSHPHTNDAVGSTCEATVVGPVEKQWCRVACDGPVLAEESAPEWARLAWAEPMPPQEGDRLLVTRGARGALYVLGLLERSAEAPGAADPALDRLSCEGAEAYRDQRDGRPVIGLRDDSGRVLVEYDPTERRTVVFSPEGDLELRSERGGIEIASRDGVRIYGEREVSIVSADCIALRRDVPGEEGSYLGFGQAGAELRTPTATIEAGRAALTVGEGRILGNDLEATIGRVRLVADRIETHAGRVLQRAKSLYRKVEELEQVSVGRLRTLVEGAWQLRSKRVDLKGHDGVKVDGKKIHLG